MAETDSTITQETLSGETQNKPANNISFSIWPPTERTRDAVINRLIESLSTPSVLSKRYGTLPHEEASVTAKLIEEEAFNAAGSTANGDGDGIEILEVYSKEISKRMIDTVKSRSVDASEPSSTSGLTEQVSSAETES
ncbi:MFP1 attachment factor 1-like [Lycium barbarum]|uniref:MFP1 attachment factor 1-like n=1 Tax=Lycium barbarum TaxID=112863 RepID=UPI00293EF35C|nr:MFP1 attachment factor 1-like [Lycium barbarum]